MLHLHHGLAVSSSGSCSLSGRYNLPLRTCSFDVFYLHNSSLSLIKCNEHRNGRGDLHLSKGYRSIFFEEEEPSDSAGSDSLTRFEEAVKLYNEREYYACHDVLEPLWYEANDPLRTLLHALLQCAVAFHHLFNQNHKGAMMELGEGVCKLRKLNFDGGPFHEFEQQISAVLNFIYQTQLELAACNEDFCVAMEQNERSYQLLEGFGAGQRLYFLEVSDEGDMDETTYIAFDPRASYGATGLPRTRVKLPTLQATRDHLLACESC